MIHELRLYQATPGRLPDLLRRFETITLALWDKHGIRQAGFWTTLVGESSHRLTYLLQWQDLAERDRCWTAFQTDPEWIARRAETERNGPIVADISSSLLVPTAFSSVR